MLGPARTLSSASTVIKLTPGAEVFVGGLDGKVVGGISVEICVEVGSEADVGESVGDIVDVSSGNTETVGCIDSVSAGVASSPPNKLQPDNNIIVRLNKMSHVLRFFNVDLYILTFFIGIR